MCVCTCGRKPATYVQLWLHGTPGTRGFCSPAKAPFKSYTTKHIKNQNILSLIKNEEMKLLYYVNAPKSFLKHMLLKPLNK